MNKMIKHFQNGTNSIVMFLYLINIVFISLLYNNPVIIIAILLALILLSLLTRKEKFLSYLKFSGLIFIVTIILNLVLNQRGENTLIELPFIKITIESLLNGLVLSVSFVNLLWAFYLYDAFIKIKIIFELLAKFFRNIAIIFVLTIRFIPQIITIFNETRALQKFRVNNSYKGFVARLNGLAQLNEIVLNKSIANFMNVADALTLKGYSQKRGRIGRTEFKRYDWILLIVIFSSILFNIGMMLLNLGKINFGSSDLGLIIDGTVWLITIFNLVMILLPIFTGGISYLWWKYYVSKTTASNTMTPQNYR